ncbi:MAG: hypothetical protein AAGH48_01540 [Pseudomonadota bacterium]
MTDRTEDDLRLVRESLQRRIDFDDLQHELVGRDVGKAARFLSAEHSRSPEARRKKLQKEAADRRLVELLTDPTYRALYERLGNRLADAETKTDQVIERYDIAIRTIHRDIAEMEARAGRGLNGQPVFRYRDGRVVDPDNDPLAPEIAAGIEWPENAPTAEAYFAAKDRRSSLIAERDEWLIYRTDTLGTIRDRYDNHDDPMSKEDMRDALDRIDEERPELSSLAAHSPGSSPAVTADVSALSLPMKLN